MNNLVSNIFENRAVTFLTLQNTLRLQVYFDFYSVYVN